MAFESRFYIPSVVCLFDLILYVPVNNFSVMSGRVFLGWTSTKQGLMCLARTQRSDTDEDRTLNPSVSSQAPYQSTEPLHSPVSSNHPTNS